MRSINITMQLLLFLFLFISCLSNKKEKETSVVSNDNVEVTESNTELKGEYESITDFDIHLLSNPTFTKWLAHYQSSNQDFSVNKFEPRDRNKYFSGITSESGGVEGENTNNNTSLYVYSPNRNYYIDFNGYDIIQDSVYTGSEVDTKVELMNVKEKKMKQVAFYGPGVGIDDAFWHNDSTYVLLGCSIDYDNTPDALSDCWKPFISVHNIEGRLLAFYLYTKCVNFPEVSYFIQRLTSKGIKIADESTGDDDDGD